LSPANSASFVVRALALKAGGHDLNPVGGNMLLCFFEPSSFEYTPIHQL